MGYLSQPSSPGITVIPVDRESGPGAGAGASGNRAIFLGSNAGLNATPSDIIALGNNALAGGDSQTVIDSGTIAIGSQTLSALNNGTLPGVRQGPSTAIGYNVFPSVPIRMGSLTALGANIGLNWPSVNPVDTSGMTLIGANVLRYHNIRSTDYGALDGCTVIGYNACAGQSGWAANVGSGCSFNKSTIIGVEACEQSGNNGPTPAAVVQNCVVIGYQAGRGMQSNFSGSVQNCVVIGGGAIVGTSPGNDNVLIGSGISITAGAASNVMIGAGTPGNFSATGLNTLIGAALQIGVGIGARNIVLGAGAGQLIPGGGSDYVSLETFDGSFRRALLFGQTGYGNLIIGQATSAQANIALNGATNSARNTLGIPDGVKATVNPTQGGYFYSIAGALHWVGSAGTDTLIAPA